MTADTGRIGLGEYLVSGITNPIFVEHEYTHPDIAQKYYDNMKVIYDVMQMQVKSSTNPTVTGFEDLTDAQVQAIANQVKAALNNLKLLAEGEVHSNTATSTKRYYLTSDMATNFDLIMRSFKSVAANPLTTLTDVDLRQWKDLSVLSPSIEETLRAALNTLPGNRSLQSLVELEYVKAGNEMINVQLSSLEEKLSTTQKILNTLTELQTLRSDNVKIIDKPPTNPQLNLADQAAYDFYTSQAELYFSKYDLFPQISEELMTFTSPVPTTDPNYFYRKMPIELTAQGQALFDKLINNYKALQSLKDELDTQLSPEQKNDQTIYGQLQILIDDYKENFGIGIDQAGTYTFTSFIDAAAAGVYPLGSTTSGDPFIRASCVYNYLVDRYRQDNGSYILSGTNSISFKATPGGNAGDIQQHLTTAITAAQSSNDTQKEEVRRFLFVFEEFYKSAAAILQRITQIIEKVAQNISR